MRWSLGGHLGLGVGVGLEQSLANPERVTKSYCKAIEKCIGEMKDVSADAKSKRFRPASVQEAVCHL